MVFSHDSKQDFKSIFFWGPITYSTLYTYWNDIENTVMMIIEIWMILERDLWFVTLRHPRGIVDLLLIASSKEQLNMFCFIKLHGMQCCIEMIFEIGEDQFCKNAFHKNQRMFCYQKPKCSIVTYYDILRCEVNSLEPISIT